MNATAISLRILSSFGSWLLGQEPRCESSSSMDGYRFSTDLTVRFSETDAQGVVHNAVYLVWFEIARVAYLGQFPGGYKGLVEHGIDATTTEAYVRYLDGTRFDDELRVHVRAGDLRGARFRFEYAVERRNEPEGLVADGWTAHACVDAQTLRPTRMPDWLAVAIAGVESPG
jgi:acyl-CoA thioester hydrolase